MAADVATASRDQQESVTSAAALGLFRIWWSALMVYSMLDVVYGSSELQAKFGDHTSFNFRFDFAESCVLLRPTVQQATAVCLAAAGAAAAVGAGLPRPFHQLASAVLLALYTTLQLWEKGRYNNHYYLDVLLAALLVVTDAHTALSAASIFSLNSGGSGQGAGCRLSTWWRHQRALTIPVWQLWAFRLQVVLVYVYGGLAKLSSHDWLFRAQPMTGWLQLPGKWTPLHLLGASRRPQQSDTLGERLAANGISSYDPCAINVRVCPTAPSIRSQRSIPTRFTGCCRANRLGFLPRRHRLRPWHRRAPVAVYRAEPLRLVPKALAM